MIVFSCVDDYDEANEEARLDAPYAYISSDIAAGEDGIPLDGGEEVTFTVNIVDAPGTLDSLAVNFSKGGEVLSHTFDAIRGQMEGIFTVTVKAPMDLNGTSSVTIDVYDAQEEPKVLSLTQVLDVSYAFDGPRFDVSLSDATAVEGDVVEVTVEVFEVPSGVIKAISIAGTAGTVVFDQAELDALIGASSGTITGELEVGDVRATGEYSVSVTITDQLQNRQETETEELFLICPSREDISGTYDVISSGVAEDEGEYLALQSAVTITQINEGQYQVDDITFGVFPEIYGVAAVEGILNVCGDQVSGDPSNEDQYGDTYEITGALYSEDVVTGEGTITLTWINSYGDQGEVILIKQ